MPHSAQRLWTHLYCVCFYVCGQQKPEDPQFPIADDAITQGGIGAKDWDLQRISMICSQLDITVQWS